MRWNYEIIECVKMAWSSIQANRLRSVLTTLGIVVGIVTVTLMGMAIEGLGNAFANSVSLLGADTLYVQRTPWGNRDYKEWIKLQSRKPISFREGRQLEKKLKSARAWAPLAEVRMGIQYKNRSASRVSIVGTTEQYEQTASIVMSEGRFLSPEDSEGGRPVCVLGSLVASNLFQGVSPLGVRLRVGGESLEVIGVVEKRGSFMGQYSFDNQVLIPAKLFTESFDWDPEVTLQIKANSVEELATLTDEVRSGLRLLRKIRPGADDDFAINQQQSILESFGRVSAIVGSVGFFISGLSLFVGGIGIMNIMFVSVAERTREIGVRKAIGAKRRTILLQFLTEAAAICLIAGLLGLALAWAASFLISNSLPVSLSPRIAALAITVSIVVGLISGFLPAWRAARLNPVDALRNE